MKYFQDFMTTIFYKKTDQYAQVIVNGVAGTVHFFLSTPKIGDVVPHLPLEFRALDRICQNTGYYIGLWEDASI